MHAFGTFERICCCCNSIAVGVTLAGQSSPMITIALFCALHAPHSKTVRCFRTVVTGMHRWASAQTVVAAAGTALQRAQQSRRGLHNLMISKHSVYCYPLSQKRHHASATDYAMHTHAQVGQVRRQPLLLLEWRCSECNSRQSANGHPQSLSTLRTALACLKHKTARRIFVAFLFPRLHRWGKCADSRCCCWNGVAAGATVAIGTWVLVNGAPHAIAVFTGDPGAKRRASEEVLISFAVPPLLSPQRVFSVHIRCASKYLKGSWKGGPGAKRRASEEVRISVDKDQCGRLCNVAIAATALGLRMLYFEGTQEW